MADKPFVGTPTLSQRLDSSSDSYKAVAKAVGAKLRVAMPGIIASFDAIAQTATIDLAIYDRIQPYLPSSIPTYNSTTGDLKIPQLLDVPVIIPRGGGFALTVPVSAGDECLVVFADMCYNEWFDSGGFNNVQQVLRRHDLSDGFAILAPTSQPKKLMAYQSSAMEMRTTAGDVKVSVQSAEIDITAPSVIVGNGGTTQPLMTEAFLSWFTTNIIPFLASKGYAGPSPPGNSVTTIVEGE